MKKIISIIAAIISICQLQAQNLVTNGDAESLPRGTGWTVISQGALTCLLVPTNNTINWTMKPDGSANYPFDHTMGASGGTVFFSGCSSIFQGPFELQQTIDVSADAATIDLGNQVYDFSGYIQTPVSNQTDVGRFIVDFLNAGNTVLGTSYNSGWQSNFDGSGISWNHYSNTRIAPAGTRNIKIRLQTQMFVNQPAINVHFDDITLTKPSVVPVSLVSFTGKEINGNIYLTWQVANELDNKNYELQRSNDAGNFNSITALPAGNTNYYFTDKNIWHDADKYFYRLKMTDINGKITYSNILTVRIAKQLSVNLSPNPAGNTIVINGLSQPGNVSIISYNGSVVLTANANTSSVSLDISRLPAGLYVVRFSYQKNSINKKLIIQHK